MKTHIIEQSIEIIVVAASLWFGYHTILTALTLYLLIWIWAQVYYEFKYYNKHKYNIFTIRMNTSWITLDIHHHIIYTLAQRFHSSSMYVVSLLHVDCLQPIHFLLLLCGFFSSLLSFLFQFKNIWYTFIVKWMHFKLCILYDMQFKR